jgi:hypothetical protein
MSLASLALAREQFEAALPTIVATAEYAFRKLRRQDREEAVAEARAAAFSAWHGLVRRGTDPVGVGITGIAHNAVRYVKNGRRIANRHCGRGALDVHHRRAQRRCGFRILSLDSDAEFAPRSASGSWRDWVIADDRANPAQQACIRIDIEAWLAGLPSRKRRMAELLAIGHETGVVAQLLGVTPGAVSQARAWLARSWRTFQGEA